LGISSFQRYSVGLVSPSDPTEGLEIWRDTVEKREYGIRLVVRERLATRASVDPDGAEANVPRRREIKVWTGADMQNLVDAELK